MGTRGAGLLHGFALGSVALRVVQAAVAPVILLKPGARLPAAFGRSLRVALAVDGSAHALRAAERLLDWRDWLGKLEVHLVYAHEASHDDVGEWSRTDAERVSEAARELFSRAGVPHELHLAFGDPAHEMARLADRTASELTVLGRRGRGGAREALVGSVALKAAASSAVPVMLVS